MKSRKQERLSGLIKEEISNILMRVLDKFSTIFVTITDVDISPDLMNVKISYSVLGGEEEKKKAKKLFQQCKSKLRFELGSRIPFRRVPVFSYEFDETIEKAAKIETILLKVNKEIEKFEENEKILNLESKEIDNE